MSSDVLLIGDVYFHTSHQSRALPKKKKNHHKPSEINIYILICPETITKGIKSDSANPNNRPIIIATLSNFCQVLLTVPALRPVPLNFLFVGTMGNNGLGDVVHLNQVMPRLEVEAKDSLMLFHSPSLSFERRIRGSVIC